MEERILLIEDEEKIARFMELELIHEGYEVEVVSNGKEGLEKIKEGDFQIVLLDIMLPEMDGNEVCRRIREFSQLPIIMVTARDGISDKVKGLDTGADDYLTKPFAIEELLARIRAQLRRNREDETNILQADDLILNTDQHRVIRGNSEIDLTKKEYDLLKYLLTNKEIVLSREQILKDIWGYDYIGETNLVDVYIRYLRSKIDEPFNNKLIHTIRGVGYVLRVNKDEVKS